MTNHIKDGESMYSFLHRMLEENRKKSGKSPSLRPLTCSSVVENNRIQRECEAKAKEEESASGRRYTG